MGVRVYERVCGWVSGCVGGRVGVWVGEWVCGCTSGCVGGRVGVWVGEWVCGWASDFRAGWFICELLKHEVISCLPPHRSAAADDKTVGAYRLHQLDGR